MCTKWSIEYAQIVTNMQQLLHLCIRDVNARACLVTALIGESSEALAKEAFQRMDVQLDLSMRTAGILEGWSLTDYQSEYKEILQTLSTGLEPRVIDGHQWYTNNQYLF